ncbi:MAG TPA: sensor domain-containing diguanylate cyclase, partial [Usitatibacteraceae bacterium]|nr:sensor domain-containing diguanylate cyclase [Usitatibacteraceae bacterium]
PLALLRDSIRQRRIIEVVQDGRWLLVIPLDYRGRLAGVLAASHRDSSDRPGIDSNLLQNLAVHIGLALENALNFTYSITDGLTGLANKRYGLTRLDEALYLAKRQGSPLALMMLDIDYFKKVNDNHGHQAGDRVLREVARRIRTLNRKSDIAVRYGGEEFMLILPHTAAETLDMLGERFRAAVAAKPVPLDDAGNTLAVTMSIGAARFDPQTDSAESLIERADKALYASKAGGRNRVTLAL